MAIDLDFLKSAYFYFDLPVVYELGKGQTIKINPVSVRNSEIFTSSADILSIDKNSSSSPEIIQMSYLKFLIEVLLPVNKLAKQKLINILLLCLGMEDPVIKKRDNKIFLYDSKLDVEISAKHFEDIRRIIMYQNNPHYDDSYINPDIKQAMDELDYVRNKDYVMPTLERKMAIISAHTGIRKKEQEEMTYRSHVLLFEEISGEVEHMTTYPIALYAGKADTISHWIYKKKKDKLDGYFVSADKYNRAMGGDGKILQTNMDETGVLALEKSIQH